MTAFTYPAEPHLRRHAPHGYADAASYRPWLRDEFTFRCVYCLFREQWGRLRGTFGVEHFRPIALHPGDTLSYDNLLYGCSACNAGKGKQLVPDPLTTLVCAEVWVNEDGTIDGHTRQARRLIRVLGLDDREYTEFRLMWLEIVGLAAREAPELHRKLMGFPDDLPNLARLAARRQQPPGRDRAIILYAKAAGDPAGNLLRRRDIDRRLDRSRRAEAGRGKRDAANSFGKGDAGEKRGGGRR